MAGEPDKGQPSEIVRDGSVATIDDLGAETRAALKALVSHEDGDEDEDEDGDGAVDDDDPPPPAEVPRDISPEDAAAEEDEPEAPAAKPPDETDKKFSAALGKLREDEQRLDTKRKSLEEDIKRLTAHSDRMKGWQDDRYGVLSKLIGEAIGTEDAAKIRGEIDALYDDLTLTVLDIPANSERKQAAATAKLKREVEALKRERQEDAEKLQAQRQQIEHEAAVHRAVSTFDTSLAAKAAEYPFLRAGAAVEGTTAGQIVWAVISGSFAKDGTEMSFEDAAKAAEQHFAQKAEAFRPLFTSNGTPAKPQPPVATSKGKRKSLTNADASSGPGTVPDPEGYIADDETSKRRALRKLRDLVRRQEESDDD